jgi:hypothetical protein
VIEEPLDVVDPLCNDGIENIDDFICTREAWMGCYLFHFLWRSHL